jgi:hypothetical protein
MIERDPQRDPNADDEAAVPEEQEREAQSEDPTDPTRGFHSIEEAEQEDS